VKIEPIFFVMIPMTFMVVYTGIGVKTEANQKLNQRIARIIPFSIFLGVSFAAYGNLLFNTGLYGDDIGLLLAYQRMGVVGIDQFLGWSRPFSPWLYQILIPIIRNTLWIYQFLLICLRAVCGWLVYRVIESVDKKAKILGFFSGLLCVVYPGFTQQAHALHYLLHFTVLALLLLSLLMMGKASWEIDNRKRFLFYAFSVFLTGIHFWLEYFAGIEALRFLLLIMLLKKSQSGDHLLRRFLRQWLPFGCVFAFYLIWRIWIFHPTYPPITLFNRLHGMGTGEVSEFISRFMLYGYTGGVASWIHPFRLLIENIPFVWWICIFGAVLSSAVIYFLVSQYPYGKTRLAVWWKWVACGALTIFAGAIPLVVSDTPVSLDFPWDRTTLCFLVGSCLAVGGTVMMIPKKLRAIVMVIFLGSAIAYQNLYGLDYRRDWRRMCRIMAELKREAPAITPGTLILYEALPIKYYSANSINGLVNWMYNPVGRGSEEQYKVFQISERLGNVLPALEPGIPIQHGGFVGSTSQVILIVADEEGGVAIAVSADDIPENIWNNNILKAAQLSRMEFFQASDARFEADIPIFNSCPQEP